MCVIVPCADPTTPGIWWREDNRWVKYPDNLQNVIRQAIANQQPNVALGVITSAVHPHGQTYVANLQSMVQCNSQSGNTRAIFVVPDPEQTTNTNTEEMDEDVSTEDGNDSEFHVPKVFYRTKEGGTKAYRSDVAREIILGAVAGMKKVSFAMNVGEHVTVSFERMKETRHHRGSMSPKVTIDLPWKPKALESCSFNKHLRTELIKGLVEGLADTRFMEKVMKEKLSSVSSVEKLNFALKRVVRIPNKNSKLNTKLKDKFITALAEMNENESRAATGEILDILCKQKVSDLKYINYIFKGEDLATTLSSLKQPGLKLELFLELKVNEKEEEMPTSEILPIGKLELVKNPEIITS